MSVNGMGADEAFGTQPAGQTTFEGDVEDLAGMTQRYAKSRMCCGRPGKRAMKNRRSRTNVRVWFWVDVLDRIE